MPATSASLTNSNHAAVTGGSTAMDTMQLFRNALLDQMREGAIFLDSHCQILQWNRSMESLTGIGRSVVGSTLTPGLLQLRTLDQTPIQDQESPFPGWLRERKPVLASYIIGGLSGRQCDVEMVFQPVMTSDGRPQGGLLLMLDTSMQNDLQRQLNALQTIATIDPLTQVGNRAEFERLLDEYVRTHKQVGLKCSLIIGDLDYFKKINDTWGHHIGDHALVAFAQLLRHHVRGRDFVARYGGEEFVILCANCDETAAAKRADVIREELAGIAQPMMQGQKMNASFGVTELREDDDPTSLFVRADKALMWAKQTGRNRVVISGQEPGEPLDDEASSGETEEPRNERSISGAKWPEQSRPPVLSAEIAAPDLLPIFVEKLKAWIEESGCRLEHITDSELRVSLTQAMPDSPKVSGQLMVVIDLVQTQGIERPTNLPEGTRVVIRVSVFGKPALWKKVDFDKLATHAIARLRKIVGLSEEKYLLKWPERKNEKRRY